ncbi:MAG: response regulator [Dehalococcoidia bacterium]
MLLIEDNPDDVAAVARLTATSSVPVTLMVATDGQEALERVHRHDDDASAAELILLDIHLPVLDGVEVLQRLASDVALRDVPVVMLTGSEDVQDIRLGQELGAKGHILKPMSQGDFTWIVASVTNYWRRLAKAPGELKKGGRHGLEALTPRSDNSPHR